MSELMLDIPYAVGLCGSIGKFDFIDALSYVHPGKRFLELPIDIFL